MPIPPQRCLQTQRIGAIALTVSDVDCSRAFYTQALGFKVVSDITINKPNYCQLEGVEDSRIRTMTLCLGAEIIRLIQYLDRLGKPIPADSRSNDRWFQHIAIVVSDMDRAYAHLASFPIEPISTSPQTIPPDNKEAAYIQAFKFKDLDRHNVELIGFPPDKGQTKWHQPTNQLFLGIDHTAIVVTDTAQSLDFYRDSLGMTVEGGSFNWGETQARMDDLPNAKVRVTALRPVQGGLGIELLEYVEPTDGRPIPPDWDRTDIAHVQVELVVNDLQPVVNRLHSYNIALTLSSIIELANYLPNKRGCRVNDPTGHALLLIEE
ncbi:VOC family protein [Pantanalinema sp. GBBB05]|uniref:VOC family protein n=1 Tax=Pantanalinema sp. GBBB05 TaxID=2604139 RepID=UPI001D3EB077|nr:VOC family protein [Pantanalinema sp. GBBB05]